MNDVENSAELNCDEGPERKRPKKDLEPGEKDSVEVAEFQVYMTEKDVGINCYITSGFKPIPGILKQRFSDFLVNEISEDGEIVHLTNTDVPDLPKPSTSQITDTLPFEERFIQELESLIASKDKKIIVKIPAPEAKEDRRSVHQYIKARFPGLVSNCVETDGTKILEISLPRKGNFDDRDRWPKDKCHLKFVLYKESKDTQEALDIISKYSGIKTRQFQYAGTKDKRAKTSQLISLFKVPAGKMAQVNSKLHGMCLGNFEYCSNQLTLGQLAGNHFKVVLRDVHTAEADLSTAAEELSSKGFINYFGMQRFGTSTVPTYEVGKCVLRNDTQAAVNTIMALRQDDDENSKKARILWKEKKSAKEALDLLPYSCFLERRLMMAVLKHGAHNLPAAFQELPRHTRSLYLHSYQSLLWNKVATRRIEKYGLKPIVGDMVFASKEEYFSDAQAKDCNAAVKCISEVDLNEFTIYDIILPIPGCKSQLPQNEAKDWFHELLKEDSLSLESFDHKQKEYRMPGSYRQLLVKPSRVKANLAYYNDITEELVSSDFDVIKGKTPVVLTEGKHQAAILEFSLPSSCYATMLLREVTRTDTSANHQSTLNRT